VSTADLDTRIATHDWLEATAANFPGRAEGDGVPGRFGFIGEEAPADIGKALGATTMNTTVSLVPIDRDGTPRGYAGALPEVTREVFRATAELYTTVGFEEPWICYLALADDTPVGVCGFKSSPRDGRVEIAYFTFPEFEGRGFASTMAAELVAVARRHGSSIVVAAQTLPERNASHRVLEKLGFRHVETVDHPEDGTVWEWRLSGQTGT
jgi:RimJ/RimL family protein N-acetyltransferase